MSTQRDLLDREIGTPPPSTIDIDSLIASQRRRGRLHTAALGGVVMVLVLAIGAVLVFLQGPGRMEWDRNVGASPSPTARPGSRPEEAARLTGALQHLMFPLMAANASLARAPENVFGQQPGEPLVFVDYGTHFAAAAVITDGAGTGTITVTVGKEETQFRADGQCMTDPAPLDVRYDCEVLPSMGGANILKASSRIGEDNYQRFYVEIIRADGNAVSVDVTNGVLRDNEPYRAQRPEPLLTMNQALALVQEPSLVTTLAS